MQTLAHSPRRRAAGHCSFVTCPRLAALFSICWLPFTAGCFSSKPPPEPPRPVATASRDAQQAMELTEKEQWPAAAAAWQRSLNQYRLLNDDAHAAIALHNLAQAERALGNSPAARGHLEQAAEINKRLGRQMEWWRNQIALLQVERQSPQTPSSASRWQVLDPLGSALTDPALRGLFLNERGLWLQQQEKWTEALNDFVQAEQSFQTAGDARGAATAIANRSDLSLSAPPDVVPDAPQQALAGWKEALRQFESLPDKHGIARALAGVGHAYLVLATATDHPKQRRLNFVMAEQFLRRASENYEILKEPALRAPVLRNLAKALAGEDRKEAAAEVEAELRKLAAPPPDQ